MSTPSRFWAALEAFPGLSALAVEWRQVLGSEYVHAARFLRPNGELASAYPCRAVEPCGCAHEVVDHGEDGLVAVCCCEEGRCKPFPVTRGELPIYEIDRRALGDAVAAALGAVPAHSPVPSLPLTWSIGACSPSAGSRFPLYLAVRVDPNEYEQVVDGLVARITEPFVLLLPTPGTLDQACEARLRGRKARVLALADDFSLADDGSIVAVRPAPEILKPFLAGVLPTPRSAMHGWGGRALSAKEAAKILDYQTDSALLKAMGGDRIQEGHPLYELRQGGPGRTRSGRFLEDAVNDALGRIRGPSASYEASVVERIEQLRATKAEKAPPDPTKAMDGFLKALTRAEKKSK